MRAAAALAVPSIILNVALLRDTAPRPRSAPKRRPAVSDTARPARTVAVHRVLRWKKLPTARMYDVVIWRDGRRVRDVWTRDSSVSVRSIACATSGGQLATGSYLWFVYPVQAAGSKRVVKLVRWGNFRVGEDTCSRPAARQLQNR